MSNKKGFVFIETIVTIVVLAAALLYVYSSFNSILIKEKTRVNYDDIAYIYRSYYIKDYFLGSKLTQVLKTINSDNPMVIIGCEYEGLVSEIEGCNKIVSDFNITNIAVSTGDLTYLKNCNDDSNKCSYLKNFSRKELEYLKTLGNLINKNDEGNLENKYIMIFEYIETDTSGNTIHNYAWIRI